MGTAGPLALARGILDDGTNTPFFVLNRCSMEVTLPMIATLLQLRYLVIWSSTTDATDSCVLDIAMQRRNLRVPTSGSHGFSQGTGRRS